MSADISWRGLNQQIDALTAELANNVRRMADDANKLHAALTRIRDLEAQDEIHWKTRRTLLVRVEALEAALREIANSSGHRTAYIRGVARAALGITAEPPIAQSKSQQKRFEAQGVVPFAEETPADYTIAGDGVWMGGKWHPSGGPKSPPGTKGDAT